MTTAKCLGLQMLGMIVTTAGGTDDDLERGICGAMVVPRPTTRAYEDELHAAFEQHTSVAVKQSISSADLNNGPAVLYCCYPLGSIGVS